MVGGIDAHEIQQVVLNLGRLEPQKGQRFLLEACARLAPEHPNVLFAPPEVVAREAVAVLDSFGPPQRADGGWDGHVFNLGHGISQHTPPEHVSALVEAVHAHSRRQRVPSR